MKSHRRRAQPASSARIDFRLPPEHKDLIERAAASMGQTVSDFAITTLVLRAHRTLEENNQTVLSRRDRDKFMNMLDDPSPPNSALKKAARRYRRGA